MSAYSSVEQENERKTLVKRILDELDRLLAVYMPPYPTVKLRGAQIHRISPERLLPLASGGDGACYRVVDYLGPGQDLVAKRMHSDSEDHDQLVSEAAHTILIGFFEPPCVIRPFLVESHFVLLNDGSHWYFTLEYVEGVSLQEWIDDDQSEADRLFVAMKLAYTLRWLKLNRILHGDLHCNNVMISYPSDPTDPTSSVLPCIIDLGRAQFNQDHDISEERSCQRLFSRLFTTSDESPLLSTLATLLTSDYAAQRPSVETLCKVFGFELDVPTLSSCPGLISIPGYKVYIDSATPDGIHAISFAALSHAPTAGLQSYQESAFPRRPFSQQDWPKKCRDYLGHSRELQMSTKQLLKIPIQG